MVMRNGDRTRLGRPRHDPSRSRVASRRAGFQIRVLGVGLVFSMVGACADAGPAPTLEVQIDTSASGVVTVSNPAEGAWARSGVAPWRLEEELRIGAEDGDGPYVFGSASNVIPDSLGRIWVMDGLALELRVFDREGAFQFAVGGPGEGPGEFSGGRACAFAGPRGEVWVEDGLWRWHRFDGSGAWLQTLSASTQLLGCGPRRWVRGGHLWAMQRATGPGPTPSAWWYVGFDVTDDGNVVPMDTVARPDPLPPPSITWVARTGTRLVRDIPFSKRTNVHFDEEGTFWFTDATPDYTIRRQTADGDTLLILKRAVDPVPIPVAVRRDSIAAFPPEGAVAQDGWDPEQVPHVYPPFRTFRLASTGHVWVTRAGAGGGLRLDIFDPSGIYLGEIEPPPGFESVIVHVITEDAVYGVWRDELGVPYVVRYAIRGRLAEDR